VVGFGVAVLGVAVVLLYRAWIGDIDRALDLHGMASPVRHGVMTIGRLGFAARAVVLALGGAFLILAALEWRPEEARGLGGTLRAIQYARYGSALLAALPLGFICHGLLG